MKVAPLVIMTPRFRLRQIRREDEEPFSAMNADPTVMEFFPNVLSREESQATLLRIGDGFQRRGFGVYALEAQGEFAGVYLSQNFRRTSLLAWRSFGGLIRQTGLATVCWD
jgi:RimJ/RimL family protein N-acetyltransferase